MIQTEAKTAQMFAPILAGGGTNEDIFQNQKISADASKESLDFFRKQSGQRLKDMEDSVRQAGARSPTGEASDAQKETFRRAQVETKQQEMQLQLQRHQQTSIVNLEQQMAQGLAARMAPLQAQKDLLEQQVQLYGGLTGDFDSINRLMEKQIEMSREQAKFSSEMGEMGRRMLELRKAELENDINKSKLAQESMIKEMEAKIKLQAKEAKEGTKGFWGAWGQNTKAIFTGQWYADKENKGSGLLIGTNTWGKDVAAKREAAILAKLKDLKNNPELIQKTKDQELLQKQLEQLLEKSRVEKKGVRERAFRDYALALQGAVQATIRAMRESADYGINDAIAKKMALELQHTQSQRAYGRAAGFGRGDTQTLANKEAELAIIQAKRASSTQADRVAGIDEKYQRALKEIDKNIKDIDRKTKLKENDKDFITSKEAAELKQSQEKLKELAAYERFMAVEKQAIEVQQSYTRAIETTMKSITAGGDVARRRIETETSILEQQKGVAEYIGASYNTIFGLQKEIVSQEAARLRIAKEELAAFERAWQGDRESLS